MSGNGKKEEYPGMGRMNETIMRMVEGGQHTARGKDRPEAGEPRKPGNVVEQRKIMADILERKMAEMFRGLHSVFRLSPGQIATLETLDLRETVQEDLLSLNLLCMHGVQHSINIRLETIMGLPPSPGGLEADWKTWWLDHASSLIGISLEESTPLRRG